MAGKRQPISPAQRVALNTAKESGRKYRDNKAQTEERIRALVREENAALELTHALDVRRCRELGVAISTIGAEALGTADRGTVHRWLKKTERMVLALDAPDSPSGVFTWEDKTAGLVRVRFEQFPTTITADDYPPVLEGVAKIDTDAPHGWTVVTDPGTIDTPMGPLRGWFSVEVEDTTGPDSLASQLTEWVEANR